MSVRRVRVRAAASACAERDAEDKGEEGERRGRHAGHGLAVTLNCHALSRNESELKWEVGTKVYHTAVTVHDVYPGRA